MTKPHDQIIPLDGTSFGPAMRALPTELMRNFVSHFVATGCKPIDAAEAAGYSASSREALSAQAGRLLRDPRVATALREEQNRVVRADVPLALRTLRDICGNPNAADRDRIKASAEILSRAGMSSTTRQQIDVSVSVQTDSEKDREITALARELGLDDKATQALLGHKPPIDAEFTEVSPELQAARDRRNEYARAASRRTPEEQAARNAQLREKLRLDGKLARIAGALERGEITADEAADKEFEVRSGITVSIEDGPQLENPEDADDQNDLAAENLE